MQFDERVETSRRVQTPGEELDLLQSRIQKRQERLGMNDLTQEELERLASQELSAYKEEDVEEVLDPSLQMSENEVALQAKTFSVESGTRVNELMGILIERGVKNTFEVVEKIGDPHLADDFHRLLVQYLSEGVSVQGLKEGSSLFKALHMTLLEVTLPDIQEEDKDFSKLVRAMENFYSGMLSIRDVSRIQSYFTIEIAVSNENDDIVFYVAVPNAKVGLLEKQMMATFPSARIAVRKGDYNPFCKVGFASGSIAKLNKPAPLPLKTFEAFEQDPLNVLLSTFSKLKKQNEGAALQLVIAPAQDFINKEYQEVLKEVRKGLSLDRALEGAAMKVARDIAGILFGDKKKDDEKDSPDVDEGEVKAITEKISSPIVYTNIRIIGSAETQERADEIVADLESAFHQFRNEPYNGISFRRVSKLGLRQLLHDYSFRMYSEKYSMRLNLKELTTMFHFPVMETKSSELKQSRLVTSDAPSNMEPMGVFIGINKHRGSERNVYAQSEDRMRHLYTIGQTGTGKTTLLKNMIMQDINNGEGVCYIDPHGVDIEDILNAIPEHRRQDVIYFNPGDMEYPMGLNMLEYDVSRPEQKSFVINEMLSIFNKLFDMKTAGGPMFEQYFRNATSLVIEDPESGNTLLDVSRILADVKFRELKLSRCKNPIVVQFWREIAAKAGGEASLANMVPYITNKFDGFLSNDILRAIVAQEKSSFNFRDIMDNRKILLVNLAKGRLGEINSHLIGLILVGKIFMAALSRVDALSTKPADFYLYIDEFQNVTTDSISAILSEARKYRLGLIIAHQFIAQLDEKMRDSVFGNVGSVVAFRVGAEDAKYIENQFSPTFSASDIMKIPNRNAYVKMLVQGYPVKPFNIETVAPVVGNPEVGARIKEFSRKTYGRERSQIEKIVGEKYFRAPVPAPQPILQKPPSVPVPAVPPVTKSIPPPQMVQNIPLQQQQNRPVTPVPLAPVVLQQLSSIRTVVPPVPLERKFPPREGSSFPSEKESFLDDVDEETLYAPSEEEESSSRVRRTAYTNPFAEKKRDIFVPSTLPVSSTASPVTPPVVRPVPVQEASVPRYGFGEEHKVTVPPVQAVLSKESVRTIDPFEELFSNSVNPAPPYTPPVVKKVESVAPTVTASQTPQKEPPKTSSTPPAPRVDPYREMP